MPIRHVKGKGWYWGSKGPFSSRAKAEQVARAAYANGYREKSGGWSLMAKHLPGQHDQAEHGNRYGGGEGKQAVVGSLHDAIAGGGVTFQVFAGETPKTGYVIATKDNEKVFDTQDDCTEGAIGSYIDSHRDALKVPNAHFGGWLDTQTGQVYLDVSIVESDRSTAIDLMDAWDQKAMWDLDKSEEVRAEDVKKAAPRVVATLMPPDIDPHEAWLRIQALGKK